MTVPKVRTTAPASTNSVQIDTPPTQMSRYGLRCGPASLAGPFVDSSTCRPPSLGGAGFSCGRISWRGGNINF